MTKVQLTFKLTRSLTDQDLENISRVRSEYGFFAVRLCPTRNELFVEYDATRYLNPGEVREKLHHYGIPVV